MVTVAVPDPLPVCETALTVTVAAMLPPMPLDFVGTPLGATYNPVVDMNPNVWVPPTMPLTCQLTAVLGAPFTVTDADADFVASACAVAVTVTCAGFGTVAGAVYSPLLEMVPLEAPPAMLHVTAVFDVPVTVAVNCCVLPAATLTAIGATEIVAVVLLDVPAQPENRTAAQAKLRNKRRRMKVLTGGAGVPIQK